MASEAPSTNYDNEIELTTGTDIVNAGPGNTLVIGEVTEGGDAGLNTLNPSDQILGGAGTDTLQITATGGTVDFAGATVAGIDIVEIRNFTTDDSLNLNVINWAGPGLWWSHNTTGRTVVDNIQNEGDAAFTGGPNGGPSTFKLNFDNGLYQGANDTQEVYLDNANVDYEVNDYEGAPGIENLNLTANGGDSYFEFDIAGLRTLMITGNAGNLEAVQEDYNGPSEYLSSIDSTAFLGNLDLSAMITDNGGLAMVNTGAGKDKLDLWGDYYADVTIDTGNGGDTVCANSGFGDMMLNLGAKKDYAYIAGNGDVEVIGGNGGDEIHVDYSWNVNAMLGNGSDSLWFYASNDATIVGGKGGDYAGGTAWNIDFKAGTGNNSFEGEAGNSLIMNAGAGADYVDAYAGNTATLNLGDGNNTVYLGVGHDIFDLATVVTGTGNDWVEVSGHAAHVTTGAGADWVDISGIDTDSATVLLGGGDDSLETHGRGMVASDSINFAGGNDTVFADNLDVLNDAGDFSGVNPGTLENVFWSEGSGSVTFDGVATGANTAGVNWYQMDTYLSQDYDFVDLADGVTIAMGDDSGNHTDISIDLVTPAGGTANFLFAALGSGHVFDDFTVSDVATLNLSTYDWDIFTTPSVVFGQPDTSFHGDADLTTINLNGGTHVTIGDVQASNLANINGGSSTGNITLQLTDVANAIVVTTGSGNDLVMGNDASSAYNVTTNDGNDTVLTNDMDDVISTGEGNDSVNSGTQNDNIDLGGGNDIAVFDPGTLDSFDTVRGGDGEDTVQASSGLGNVVDDFFFNWSDVEWLMLSNGFDKLTLNDIADQNGPSNIVLGGGDDVITAGSGYMRTLAVYLSTGSADKVDFSGTTNDQATLKIYGDVTAFNNDTLKGGTSLGDQLIMTADNGTADLSTGTVTGIETITVLKGAAESDDATIITANQNVASGQTMVVDASALTDTLAAGPAGDFTFDGSDEGNGNFNLTSGDGNDTITTGGGNDTIVTGNGNDSIISNGGADSVSAGSGNDSVATNGGNDTIDAGSGNDTVDGGGGADSIDGGTGNDLLLGDGGNDTINGGDGDDTIIGGNGADVLSGSGSDDDTFVYETYNQSRGGNGSVDTITDFNVHGENDQIDLSALNGGSNTFIGNAASFGFAQGMLTGVAGQVVYQQDDNILWMDDGDAALNGNDLQIVLTGVNMIDGSDLILTPV